MLKNDIVVDPDGSQHTLAEIEKRLRKLTELCRNKKFEEAHALSDEVIAKHPENFRGYANKAFVFKWAGDYKAALDYETRALARAPQHLALYFSRATLHYDNGNYAAAIPDFTRSAELDGNNKAFEAAPYLYRADCHRRLGDYEAALADCALVPDGFDFPGFLGHFEGTKEHLLAAIRQDRDGKPGA